MYETDRDRWLKQPAPITLSCTRSALVKDVFPLIKTCHQLCQIVQTLRRFRHYLPIIRASGVWQPVATEDFINPVHSERIKSYKTLPVFANLCLDQFPNMMRAVQKNSLGLFHFCSILVYLRHSSTSWSLSVSPRPKDGPARLHSLTLLICSHVTGTVIDTK